MKVKSIIKLGGTATLVVFLSAIVRNTLMVPGAAGVNSDTSFESYNLDYVVQATSDALSFKTLSIVSNRSAALTHQYELLHASLRQHFPYVFSEMDVQTIGAHSLILHWQGQQTNKQPNLFYAHQDVVDAGKETLNDWRYPPFSGEIADGEVWGRGAVDMKSTMVAMLAAANRLIEAGFQPQRDLYFAFGDDEEIGGLHAVQMAKYFADQGIHFDSVFDEGGLILNGLFANMEEPLALIGVAEKGYLTLNLTVHGDGGHSSMPPKQSNAAILAEAIVKIESNPMPPRINKATRELLLHVAPQLSLPERVVFSNQWLFRPMLLKVLASKPSTNATIRTTFATTTFHSGFKDNVLPASGEATVNVRLLPGDDSAEVIAYIQQLLDGMPITISPSSVLSEAIDYSALGDAYDQMQTALQAEYGDSLVVTPYMSVNASDSRHFRRLTKQIYRFVPIEMLNADLNMIHGVNERISVKSLLTMANYYSNLFQQQ